MGTSESSVSLKDIKSNFQLLKEQNHPYLGPIKIWKNRMNNFYFSKQIPSSYVNAKNQSMYDRRKALNHPNIVKLLYFDSSEQQSKNFDGFWEYPGETTLSQANTTESKIWKIIDQIIQGCSAYQLRGFYHGDIQPENIFLDQDNKILLVESTLIPGLQSGYSNLLSPQDLESAKKKFEKPQSDRYKSDVYSLGMTILQLVTKQNSFDCYDFPNYQIKQQILADRIQMVQQQYSTCLVTFLQLVLTYQQNERPTFVDLNKMMDNLHTSIDNEQPFYKDLIFCTCGDHSKHKKIEGNLKFLSQSTQTENLQPPQQPQPIPQQQSQLQQFIIPIPKANVPPIFAIVVNPANGQILGEINIAEPVTQQQLTRAYSPQSLSANPSPSRIINTTPFLQQSPDRQIIQPQQLKFDELQQNGSGFPVNQHQNISQSPINQPQLQGQGQNQVIIKQQEPPNNILLSPEKQIYLSNQNINQQQYGTQNNLQFSPGNQLQTQSHEINQHPIQPQQVPFNNQLTPGNYLQFQGQGINQHLNQQYGALPNLESQPRQQIQQKYEILQNRYQSPEYTLHQNDIQTFQSQDQIQNAQYTIGQVTNNFGQLQQQEKLQNNASQLQQGQDFQSNLIQQQFGQGISQNNYKISPGLQQLQPNYQINQQNHLQSQFLLSPNQNLLGTSEIQLANHQYLSPQQNTNNFPLNQGFTIKNQQQNILKNQQLYSNQPVNQDLQAYTNIIESTNYSMVKDYSNKELDKRVEKALIVSKSLLEKLDQHQY